MSGPGYHQGLRTRAKLIVLKGFGQVIISISPEKKLNWRLSSSRGSEIGVTKE